MYILNFCTDPNLLRGLYFIKILIEIIKISAIIILIVTLMIELTKAVMSQELLSKIPSLFKNKAMAAAMVFLIPTIVTTVLTVAGLEGDFKNTSCWINANPATIKELNLARIARIKAEEEKIKVVKAKEDYLAGTFPTGSTSNDLAINMLKIASEQLGNLGTKYQTYYGFNRNTPWCAMFTSWVSEQSKVIPTYVKKASASTVTLYNYYKNSSDIVWRYSQAKGGPSYTPKKGDYIMFKYRDGVPVSHIGIVESATSSKVTYIHGNTGSGGSSKTTVKRGSYNLNNRYIVGYASWY